MIFYTSVVFVSKTEFIFLHGSCVKWWSWMFSIHIPITAWNHYNVKLNIFSSACQRTVWLCYSNVTHAKMTVTLGRFKKKETSLQQHKRLINVTEKKCLLAEKRLQDLQAELFKAQKRFIIMNCKPWLWITHLVFLHYAQSWNVEKTISSYRARKRWDGKSTAKTIQKTVYNDCQAQTVSRKASESTETQKDAEWVRRETVAGRETALWAGITAA